MYVCVCFEFVWHYLWWVWCVLCNLSLWLGLCMCLSARASLRHVCTRAWLGVWACVGSYGTCMSLCALKGHDIPQGCGEPLHMNMCVCACPCVPLSVSCACAGSGWLAPREACACCQCVLCLVCAYLTPLHGYFSAGFCIHPSWAPEGPHHCI